MHSTLLNDLRKNNLRAISRLISSVENGEDSVDQVLDALFPHSRETIRIGITGPPGAGKSTLIDKLIVQMRGDGKSVGVISVDPTSPFSGGALLGDRVRMNEHSLDPEVYVRSMGSRGHTGGLAKMTHRVTDVIACTGKDYILVETLGVGQDETEIMEYVDITVVVFVPESGDDIQFMKAGPVEVGDIFVINKADREGADRIAQVLQDHVMATFQDREFVPRILLTCATKGEGVESLYAESLGLLDKLRESGTFRQRRHAQYLARVRSAVRDELLNRFWNRGRHEGLMERISELREQSVSPYQAARTLVASLS